MEGWISLQRKFLAWRWFDDDAMVRFFIYLLLKANHADADWYDTTIKRGQLMTSIDTISRELHKSAQQVRTMIKRLKSTSEITSESTNKYTIITICKYDYYQNLALETNKQTNKQTNKRATNGQQTNNKRATTTKEYKEYKEGEEINNIYNPLIFPPSLDDIAAFCRMRNNYIDPERFLKWYTNNGWTDNKKKPISDWRNAIYNWEKRDRADGKIPPPPGVRLGLGEFMKPDGTRSYGDGRVSVPLDAPPRPSPSYFWLASSNCWMID